MASNARVNTRADRIKQFLFTHAGAWYCVSCIAAELGLAADNVRTASLWVRGLPGIRLGQEPCSSCKTNRRLVLSATRTVAEDG